MIPTGFHKWRWRLVTLWIVGFTLVTAYGLKQGATALEGLCALRTDIQARHDTSIAYLAQHPEQEPIRGITRQALLNSVKQQERTLDALSGLGCDDQ